MPNYDVLISGAGVAGLTLAHRLAQAGHRVAVVERSPGGRDSGYAVDFRGPALQVLEELGILDELRTRQTGLAEVTLLDPDGNVTGLLPTSEVAGDLEVRKPVLMELLRRATAAQVPVTYDDTITSLSQTPTGVRATFERRLPGSFDLVVGADGVHSRVRTLTLDPGRASIRHLDLAGVGFTTDDRDQPSRTGTLWQAPGLAAYVVDAGEANRRTVSLSFAATSTDLDHLPRPRQEERVRHAFAGARWRIPELLDQMDAADDFYFASGVQVVLDRWATGRVVLIGDAAGCAAPTSGMGTSQALLAAASLATHLTTKPDHRTAFTSYETEMRPLVSENQEAGRRGAQTFGAPAARGADQTSGCH